MRSRSARVTSTGESCCDFIKAASSVMVWKYKGVSGMAVFLSDARVQENVAFLVRFPPCRSNAHNLCYSTSSSGASIPTSEATLRTARVLRRLMQGVRSQIKVVDHVAGYELVFLFGRQVRREAVERRPGV